ncbi:hypothetical protein Tco_0680865 [Tanacetum coccineum]|uniref:Uncharacterized protein n=1 Tax=Tanacetum coccineum TaxID=301880 RepID=A0ABQ4XN56_9ASTR
MSSITTQQAKLDLELIPKEQRPEIGKCNGRLNPRKIQREPTFQVVLDALALTLCHSVFLITADVPEVYMHQFWDLVYKHDTFYRFKMEKKKRFKLTLEIFRDIFKICPKMHQPWRTFVALINKSLSRKTPGLDKLRLSRAQILWGMYHQNNVNDVELLWEDFIYQIDNKAYKKQEEMYYPRFTKVIIHYFLTQDKTLSWRNKIEMHTSRDDYLINTLTFVSAKEETQIYGAILPDSLTSPEMKETKACKTYLGFATGATPLKKARKFKKPASPKLTTAPVSTEEPTRKLKRVKRPTKKSIKAPARGVVIKETPKIPLSKKKEKVDVTREVRRKSKRDFHKTHPSGSGAVKIIPLITSEGTGVKPGVPDMTEEESSKSGAESWGNDEDDSNNDQDSSGEDSDHKNDSDDDKTQSDNENESEFEHETDENESGSESDQDKNEEDKDNEEEVKDELVKTPSNYSDNEYETKITDKVEGDEDEEMDYTTNAEIVSPIDVHVHHEVLSQQIPTFLIVHVLVISDSSPVFSTVIIQSLPSFTPPLQQSTSTPPSTTDATNPQSTLPNFAFAGSNQRRIHELPFGITHCKDHRASPESTASDSARGSV